MVLEQGEVGGALLNGASQVRKPQGMQGEALLNDELWAHKVR